LETNAAFIAEAHTALRTRSPPAVQIQLSNGRRPREERTAAFAQ